MNKIEVVERNNETSNFILELFEVAELERQQHETLRKRAEQYQKLNIAKADLNININTSMKRITAAIKAANIYKDTNKDMMVLSLSSIRADINGLIDFYTTQKEKIEHIEQEIDL